MKKTNKKGFTIVELVIVIAVIAILAAVLVPTFTNVVKKANESAVLQAARNAYTVYLADDIADGTLDKQANGTALTTPTNVTAIELNDDATDYETFTYKDDAKKIQASYDGTKWTISDIPTTNNANP